MKEEGKNYCDTSKVFIAPIGKDVAKEIIVKNMITTIQNQNKEQTDQNEFLLADL